MSNKKSFVTVTDQFCGAGGSSIGATAAGVELSLALNHWGLAVETHNTNFPDADHDCADVSNTDPRRYYSTDILITSPECTNHSLAKGVSRKRAQLNLFGDNKIDPAADRSRATMWDVPRFAEYHQYNIIIVENVVDARKWILFDDWLRTMLTLGYEHQIVYFNSMFAWPTPQSRDRMYVVFWRKGNPAPDLEFRPPAPCHTCEATVEARQAWKDMRKMRSLGGKYQQQYFYLCPYCNNEVTPYYFAAANAIDWTLEAPRIGDRKKPLKKKTIERIKAGLEKYGRQMMVVDLAYTHSRAEGRAYATTGDTWPTQTSSQSLALAGMPYLSILRNNSTPHGVLDGTAPTIVAGGHQHSLVIPAFLSVQYTPGYNKGVEEPLGTITGQDHHALITVDSLIAMAKHGSGFVGSTNYFSGRSRDAMEPLPTQTSRDSLGVVTLPFLSSYYGQGGGASFGEAIPTVTSIDKHAVVAPPFLMGYYTRDKKDQAMGHVGEPVPTQSTQPRHYIVEHNGPIPDVEDCGFRMLQPHEIGGAMAFPSDYVVLGNKREQVKQYGNAVTPPIMKMLVERCVATLA